MRYKIREALKIKGITSKQMASILGVSEGTFSGYVNGDHDPKSENLSKIALTCGVSTDFLLGITDDPSPVDTKNAPEPATTDSEAIRRMQLLINSFEAAGYVRPGEDLTDEQLRFCMALVDFLDTYFGRNT